MKCRIALVMLALALTGCGIAYESRKAHLEKTAKIEDYGPRPPADYQDLERQMILNGLKDPESARIEFLGSPMASIIQARFASPKPILVWVSSARVNAKNSFGGYNGFSLYQFAWRDGKVVGTFSQEQGFWSMTR
jgi:hypothetical protein